MVPRSFADGISLRYPDERVVILIRGHNPDSPSECFPGTS